MKRLNMDPHALQKFVGQMKEENIYDIVEYHSRVRSAWEEKGFRTFPYHGEEGIPNWHRILSHNVGQYGYIKWYEPETTAGQLFPPIYRLLVMFSFGDAMRANTNTSFVVLGANTWLERMQTMKD